MLKRSNHHNHTIKSYRLILIILSGIIRFHDVKIQKAACLKILNLIKAIIAIINMNIMLKYVFICTSIMTTVQKSY